MSLVGVYCEDPGLLSPTEFSWERCLACASKPHPCTLPYALLKTMHLDVEEGHSFPSVTSLTGCLRQAWLKHSMDYHEYPSSLISLLVGTAFHTFLENAGGDGSLAEIKVQWTTPEGVELHGIVDSYNPVTKTLTDWKTAKKIIVSKIPYGAHEAQTNVYAFMLAHNELEPRGEVEKIRVVYFDKTGPDTHKGEHNGVANVVIPKWSDQKVEEFIRKRAAILGATMAGGDVPPMIERSRRWMCRAYCPAAIKERCEEIG